MKPTEKLLHNLYDHCVGSGNPTLDLVERGIFPANWVSRFLALVKRASSVWKDEEY